MNRGPSLPQTPDELREILGPGFVADFASRLEALKVGVVVVPDLSTAYSFEVGGWGVIAVPPTGSWFRSNWSIAHELGHLCLKHEGVLPETDGFHFDESQANAFAAELLLPEAEIRRINWMTLDLPGLASFLWEAGVSTQALKTRLNSLGLSVSAPVETALTTSTQQLLRRHWHSGETDLISARMGAAAARHFPSWLISEHLRRVQDGRLHKGTLAWLLDIEEEDLEGRNRAPGDGKRRFP